jgi:DNA replication protein DnaC
MEQKQLIRQYCQQFNMSGINKVIDELITEAEAKAQGYMDYTLSFLRAEADYRQQKDIKKRMKLACLPKHCDLSTYDHSVNNGLTISKLHQLQELHWMDQIFNIICMGHRVPEKRSSQGDFVLKLSKKAIRLTSGAWTA